MTPWSARVGPIMCVRPQDTSTIDCERYNTIRAVLLEKIQLFDSVRLRTHKVRSRAPKPQNLEKSRISGCCDPVECSDRFHNVCAGSRHEYYRFRALHHHPSSFTIENSTFWLDQIAHAQSALQNSKTAKPRKIKILMVCLKCIHACTESPDQKFEIWRIKMLGWRWNARNR